MKLSKKTDYAIRILISLAVSDDSDIVTIATKNNISTEYLRKVGQDLSRGGFVNSKTGRSGGFTLATAPENISVYDVIIHMEKVDVKKQNLVDCSTCIYNKKCMFDNITRGAQSNFYNTYKKYTLSDLV